jgi:hypothetical protein
VPPPEPLAGVTVSHEALLAAVHAHPDWAVSVLEPLPAAAVKLALAGETV